jgi:hypothetical protein
MEASEVLEQLRRRFWFTEEDEIEELDSGHEDTAFFVTTKDGDRFVVTVAKVSE